MVTKIVRRKLDKRQKDQARFCYPQMEGSVKTAQPKQQGKIKAPRKQSKESLKPKFI